MSVLYYASPIEKKIQLQNDEVKHLKTIKKTTGDTVLIVNGKGQLFEGILSIENKKTYVSFESTLPIRSQKQAPFHLCIAPTKNTNRIEWLVEKSTELGIHSISFFYSTHSERRVIKTERLKKKPLQQLNNQNNCIYLSSTKYHLLNHL